MPQGGVKMGGLGYEKEEGEWVKYGVSKCGNIYFWNGDGEAMGK